MPNTISQWTTHHSDYVIMLCYIELNPHGHCSTETIVICVLTLISVQTY